MGIAKKLSDKGNLPIVGVPKTIDNDLSATGNPLFLLMLIIKITRLASIRQFRLLVKVMFRSTVLTKKHVIRYVIQLEVMIELSL
mgnify:FL=1